MLIPRNYLLTLCMLAPFTLLGQSQIPYDIPTPNTASLGKYGCVPVSLYTGVPDISIPLYDLTVRNVTLPLRLRYDASGLQINSLPGWLGHNWSLEAGGVITRTVKGRYDEWIYPQQSTQNMTFTPKNFYQSLGVLPELLANSANNYQALKEESSLGEYDLAADVFMFNFMGHTGRFFLDNSGNWRVLSDDNLEIIFNYNDPSNFTRPFISQYPYQYAIDRNQPKTIKGFKIRDGNGVMYEFGGNMDAIEFTTNFYNMSSNEDNESWHAMSWYLTKVTDRYGNVLLSFTYERGCYIVQAFNSFETASVDEYGNTGYILSWLFPLHYGQSYTTTSSIYVPYSFTMSSPVYLKTIDGANGVRIDIISSNSNMATENMYNSVYPGNHDITGLYQYLAVRVNRWTVPNMIGAFHYLQTTDNTLSQYKYNPAQENLLDFLRYTRLRKLEKIVIRTQPTILNGPDEPVIGYRFFYSYNSRMHLDSVRVTDRAVYAPYPNSVMNSAYRFKYDHFENVPSDYVTKAYDHWGYYNGRYYSVADLASGSYNFNNFKATRDPVFDKAKLGSLTEIQYPTGGCTVFEYETNDFSKCMSDDRQTMRDSVGTGGGLRIKSVTDYDGPSHTQVLSKRTYEYKYPGTNISSGELFAAPKYYWPGWTAYVTSGEGYSTLTTFRTASILPLANSFGPSLGYSCVTEKNGDNSKTTYWFSNLSDPDFRDEPFLLSFQNGGVTPYDEFSERGFKRGKPLLRTSYNPNGVKLSSTGYRYRFDDISGYYTLTYNMGYVNNGNSAALGYFSGGVYKMYYPKYDMVEESDTVFEAQGQLVTKTVYGKNDWTLNMTYGHSHTADVRVTSSVQTERGSQSERVVNVYMTTPSLTSSMFCLEPEEVRTYSDGLFVKSTATSYRTVTCNGSQCLVPSVVTETNSLFQTDTLINYLTYTPTGAVSSYKERGKPVTYLKWGWNDIYLLVRSTASTPLQIPDGLLFNPDSCAARVSMHIRNTAGISEGYAYHPLTGIVAAVSPRGYVTRYFYDVFTRLSGIYEEGKARKLINYNYYKGPFIQ